MAVQRIASRIPVLMVVALGSALAESSRADDEDPSSQVRRAIAYLDSRQEAWSRFGSAGRGVAEDRTNCLSCHTGITYSLTRRSLGRFVAAGGPSAPEARTIDQVTRRVDHWSELDSPRYRLMYDHDDRKKVESWGTEAVLNSLILASNDHLGGRAEPAPASRTALAHLWEAQEAGGEDAGSWAWLNFGLQPWEGEGSRAFGAALAAIAVGSAPGYLDGPLDDRASRGVALLRDYLRRRFPAEGLHNRLWILEASATFPGLLAPAQVRDVLAQVRAAQRDDGGWSLAALGPFRRVDGSTQSEASDGYATGLALHALLRAGSPAARPELARGHDWLRSHQRADGSWPGVSVNKERDPTTFTGKLMIDAATAFAARALAEAASN